MKKLSNTKKTTIGVMIALFVAFIGYDIFIAVEPTEGDTISAVTLEHSEKHPMIPMAAGILCGHLFWPANFSKSRKKKSLIAMLIGSGGIIVLDLLGCLSGVPPIAMFLGGVVAGHFGWSQNKKRKGG